MSPTNLKQPPASDRLLAALHGISSLMMTGKSVDSELSRELGFILYAIARGEPAKHLFRQDRKTKPKADRTGVALVYHYVLACTDDADLAVMKAAVAQSFGQRTGDERPLTKSSVLKVAQKYRAAVLTSFAKNPDGATERARYYMLNTRQLYVLHNGGDVTQGNLSPQEAGEFTELMRYKLTTKKVAALREYFRKKSPRPT